MAFVSIANGDSFGELPNVPTFPVKRTTVSIANGDSFGELPTYYDRTKDT